MGAGLILICALLDNCPLADQGRPESQYPYYHNTRTESPIRKVDEHNYPRPVPLHEHLKKRLGSV